MLFVDVKQAFDSVTRNMLIKNAELLKQVNYTDYNDNDKRYNSSCICHEKGWNSTLL